MLHCRLRILRLIVSRISLLGYNIEDTSIKYSTYVGSLPVGIRSRMVVLFVVGVGKCCGRLKCLRVCMGQKMNLA